MGRVKEFYMSLGELMDDEDLNPSCVNCGSKDVRRGDDICDVCFMELRQEKLRQDFEWEKQNRLREIRSELREMNLGPKYRP